MIAQPSVSDRTPQRRFIITLTICICSLILSACLKEKEQVTTTEQIKQVNTARTFSASVAEKGVVRVIVATKAGRSLGYGSGSGFYIGDNHIITNHHVIENASKGKLVVARKIDSTSIEVLDAQIIWKDQEVDIAILKVTGITCEPQILSEANIEKGSRAYAIGYPTSADASRRSGSTQLGVSERDFINLVYSSQRGIIEKVSKGLVQFLDPTVSSGEIRKSLVRKWKPNYKTELEVLDHDVNIGHGNSGGPLFDECGRIIGINTQGLDAGSIKGLSLADTVKNSSRITELIKILESQSISAQIKAEPCVIVIPSKSTTTTVVSGELDWKIWAVIGAVGLAAVTSLLVAMFKKAKTESYTQYIKRVSGVSRIHSKSEDPPPISPLPLPSPPQGWTIQGENPEPGKTPNIDFKLTLEQIQHYGGEVTIGRKPGSAQLVIDNTSISKAHAIITLQDQTLTVKDLNSSNGTKVNGSRIKASQITVLKVDDTLQLGEVSLTIGLIS